MQDKDAAYTLPAGGDMSIWNQSTLYGTQSRANPNQQQVREQGSSQRILVVEDDASLANLEADILAAHGYVVAIAHDGEAGDFIFTKFSQGSRAFSHLYH